MSIGENVRERRHTCKLTQEQLSKKSGISRAHIAKVETGKKGFSVEKLVSVAKALDCTVDDLCREEGK